MKLMASVVEWILSASWSLISMSNSSSKAMTSSTASRLSSPRSDENTEVAVTLLASTLSNFLITSSTRLSTSPRVRGLADGEADEAEDEEGEGDTAVAVEKEREMDGEYWRREMRGKRRVTVKAAERMRGETE
jgi:hypothetical protein